MIYYDLTYKYDTSLILEARSVRYQVQQCKQTSVFFTELAEAFFWRKCGPSSHTFGEWLLSLSEGRTWLHFRRSTNEVTHRRRHPRAVMGQGLFCTNREWGRAAPPPGNVQRQNFQHFPPLLVRNWDHDTAAWIIWPHFSCLNGTFINRSPVMHFWITGRSVVWYIDALTLPKMFTTLQRCLLP